MAKGKQEDLIEKFMAAPVNDAPTKHKENTDKDKVVLSNKRTLTIKPTKLKYFKNGDYGIYRVVEQLGVHKILDYSDGFDLVCRFLSAVFDKPYTLEQIKDDKGDYTEKFVFDTFVSTLVDDELNIKDLASIIEASKHVNGIVDENFQQTPQMAE